MDEATAAAEAEAPTAEATAEVGAEPAAAKEEVLPCAAGCCAKEAWQREGCRKQEQAQGAAHRRRRPRTRCCSCSRPCSCCGGARSRGAAAHAGHDASHEAALHAKKVLRKTKTMMSIEPRNEQQMLRQFWKKYPTYNLNALMRKRYEELIDARAFNEWLHNRQLTRQGEDAMGRMAETVNRRIPTSGNRRGSEPRSSWPRASRQNMEEQRAFGFRVRPRFSEVLE